MKVVSFYHFLELPEVDQFRDDLQALCDEQGLLGTILVANEGFNGTLAGEQLAVETVFRSSPPRTSTRSCCGVAAMAGCTRASW